MSEQEEIFSDLTPEEFEQVITDTLSPDFHDLTPENFFAALAAIDEEEPRETLELTFLKPAPLHAHGNEIRLGDKRVIIKLVPEEASSAA